MSLPRILVVEDEPGLMFMITTCLRQHGYRVIEATDGQLGLDAALRERPALVVLDVNLPRLDGLTVCRHLRQVHFDAPILMLTTRREIAERVQGLEAGADDYLGKPFAVPELLARISALLRRHHRARIEVLVLEFGNIHIDLAKKSATRDGRPLELTKTEYALLELLAKHAGEPVSRERILDVVWGYTRFPTTRTVDTHIWRLRKKLGDDGEQPRWIKRVHGEGYCLAVETAQP